MRKGIGLGFIRIACGACGNTWKVHSSDNWKDDSARCCPYCGSEIDKQTWNNQVLLAFLSMEDANRELYKDSTGYGTPFYIVEYSWQGKRPEIST